MNIGEFKEKKTWAVIGSVHDHEKYAYKIYGFLKRKGYKVYPVDPSGQMVDGNQSYKTLTDIPEVPDAVDMVINPIKGSRFVEEAASLGIKYIWFQPGAESNDIIEKSNSLITNVISNHCVMVEF
jgi:predicted CoA-binding protein